MIQLASHTIDERLLPDAPLVLDVGCRGFDFAAAVMKIRPRARVYCLDPDPAVADDDRRWLYWDYYPYALIGTGEVAVEYCDWHDGFGNFVTATAVPWFHQQVAANGGRKFDVRAINISEFSKLTVPHWDLVKLDCEASEFSILEHWPGPIATQISVEFHDYMHREKWGKMYFDGLFNYKLTDYEVVQHEDFAACDNAMGHWDSLLVLKGER